MSILDWIDFGKISAERDDHLSKYFYDNGVLTSVLKSPSSFLVLGRKGAGKTAVFKYLTENSQQFIDKKDVLVSLSFEDYNWKIHSLLRNETKSESLVYKQSWRFVILIECIKSYAKAFTDAGRPIPKKIASAQKLLEKLFDSPIPSIYDIVGRKLLSLSSLKLPTAGVDLESGSFDSINVTGGEVNFEKVQEKSELRQLLSENIENLINQLDRAMADASSDWPVVFLCFDRVDEAWDEVSVDTSRRVIAGLVSACDSINSQYKGKLRPIVFLREDIFDVLSLNDANKLREDCGALLYWNKETLTNLILKRVNYFAKERSVANVSDLDSLFDKNEMRQRARPTNYILRRTMMRPRDLICLYSKTVDTMKEKTEDPFADGPVVFEKLECESVYGAEPGYSEWLKREVIEEWKVQRPEINYLFQAIQNNGSTNFNQETLNRELSKLIGEVAPSKLLEYMRFLFDNSVIGFKLGASNEWKYKCFAPSQGFVESEEYRIHEGLIRALNLTERTIQS